MVVSNVQLQKLREQRLKRITARRERVRQIKARARSAANKRRAAVVATKQAAQAKPEVAAKPEVQPKAQAAAKQAPGSNRSILAAAKRSLRARAVPRPPTKGGVNRSGGCNCGGVGYY